jgi:hypothetical protein
MRDVTHDNFGLLIAYLLPGFVVLWGAAYHVETARSWIGATPSDAPTVGGFLYATLASTAAGLIVSAVRWAIVDRVMKRLGVRQPAWDFDLFAVRLAAYEVLVAQHYRYYQFYANMLVALAWAYSCRLAALKPWGVRECWVAFGFVLIEAVLFVGSWDTLRKYYGRTAALLGAGPTALRAADSKECRPPVPSSIEPRIEDEHSADVLRVSQESTPEPGGLDERHVRRRVETPSRPAGSPRTCPGGATRVPRASEPVPSTARRPIKK